MDLSYNVDLTPDELSRFWDKVEISGDCWIWMGAVLDFGYGQFKVRSYTLVAAHRLSWYIKNGPIQKGLLVLHKCDNPPCVNPDHLYVGTDQDNANDMVDRGRCNGGRKNHESRFTQEDAENMKRLRSLGKTYKEIGDMYGITLNHAENFIKDRIRNFRVLS